MEDYTMAAKMNEYGLTLEQWLRAAGDGDLVGAWGRGEDPADHLKDKAPAQRPDETNSETDSEDETFECAGCGKTVGWDQRCADDMLEHCDSCWWASRQLVEPNDPPTACTAEGCPRMTVRGSVLCRWHWEREIERVRDSKPTVDMPKEGECETDAS